jgi:hypothetical protein
MVRIVRIRIVPMRRQLVDIGRSEKWPEGQIFPTFFLQFAFARKEEP